MDVHTVNMCRIEFKVAGNSKNAALQSSNVE